MTVADDQVRQLDADRIVQVYRRAPVVFTRGSGMYLYDADGTPYLDLISGIGVASLGHAHPALAKAIAEQAATLLHTSNLFHHPLQGLLASRLAELSGLPRAFFCNSGAEAVEACLKFARRYWYTQGEPRHGFVALENSFHGRTFGALSVTWDEQHRALFAPLVPSVAFVSPAQPSAILEAVTSSTAAVIVEPIQGEGGVRPLTRALVDALEEARQRSGALIIADEVQSGLGRTGHAFYSSVVGLRPDLMALGKALGGGVPVGAALVSEAVAGALAFGDHGSTYGGNLLASRAGLVVLEQLTEGGLIDHVARMGTYLGSRLHGLAAKHRGIVDVRGAGLMWGLELAGDATPVIDEALRRKTLVNRTVRSVVRLLPPLIISEADIDRGIQTLDEVFLSVAAGVSS